MSPPTPRPGPVAQELESEFPGLAVWSVDCPVLASGASRERLDALADRVTGASVITGREDAIPWAYRLFWRQVGLDPDVDRTPIEALALERLRHGGLRSRGVVADAVAIATLETGIGVLALDASAVEGTVGLRLAEAGESLGDRALAARSLVYADRSRALALLGGELEPDCVPTRATDVVALICLQLARVSDLAVHEALWTACAQLTAGP